MQEEQIKRTPADDLDKLEIDGLIHQWTRLSEFIEKLDTEHWQVFTVIFASFGLYSLINKAGNIIAIYWVIPLTIMILFYYEAYRLREIAIMKGYLARIEKRINKIVKNSANHIDNDYEQNGEELFNWYYSHEIVFMTNNNIANRFFPIPVMLACIVILGICLKNGCAGMNDSPILKDAFIVVVSTSACFDAIALFSIKQTLKITYAAFTGNITKLREKYWKSYEDSYDYFELSDGTSLRSTVKTIVQNIRKAMRKGR